MKSKVKTSHKLGCLFTDKLSKPINDMPANALRAELIQCHKQLIFGISGRSRNQQDYFW